jgi:hypothetical protein
MFLGEYALMGESLMDEKETGCEDMNWIHLAHDWEH